MKKIEMSNLQKKHYFIGTVLLLTIVIIFVFFFLKKKSMEFPVYNETKDDLVVIGEKADIQTSEKQINEFYSIARNILSKRVKMLNFDNYSLFVKKIKDKKGMYYINYICENQTINMRYENTMTITLKNNNLKEYEYEYEVHNSDLWNMDDLFK
ncbi:TPA: hypothetical protein IUD88_001217 [Enterococcus faecalis]|nr:hypothetical protein [Enterococcus faecalis]